MLSEHLYSDFRVWQMLVHLARVCTQFLFALRTGWKPAWNESALSPPVHPRCLKLELSRNSSAMSLHAVSEDDEFAAWWSLELSSLVALRPATSPHKKHLPKPPNKPNNSLFADLRCWNYLYKTHTPLYSSGVIESDLRFHAIWIYVAPVGVNYLLHACTFWKEVGEMVRVI